MKLKLKDPWSAITHGIALLLAAAGAAPLLLKAAHGENAPLHITALAIFIHYDPSLYSKYGLPFCRFYRESKPSAQKNGSHDDLCYDCRKLYSNLSHRTS